MTDKNKNVSLLLLLGVLFFALPLHADELTGQQSKLVKARKLQLGILVNRINFFEFIEDNRGALKATNKALQFLERFWSQNKEMRFTKLELLELQANYLFLLQKWEQARDVQLKAVELAGAMVGRNHWMAIETAARLEEFKKIISLSESQRQELFDAEKDLLTLREEGSVDENIAASKKMAEMQKKYFGKKDSGYLDALLLLAEVLHQKSDLLNLGIVQQEILDVAKDIYGERHPTTADLLFQFASSYEEAVPISLANNEKAIDLYRQSLSRFEDLEEHDRGYPEISHSSSLVSVWLGLGRVYYQLGDLEQSEKYLKKILSPSIKKTVSAPLHRSAGGDQAKEIFAAHQEIAFAHLVLIYDSQKNQAELNSLFKRFPELANDALFSLIFEIPDACYAGDFEYAIDVFRKGERLSNLSGIKDSPWRRLQMFMLSFSPHEIVRDIDYGNILLLRDLYLMKGDFGSALNVQKKIIAKTEEGEKSSSRNRWRTKIAQKRLKEIAELHSLPLEAQQAWILMRKLLWGIEDGAFGFEFEICYKQARAALMSCKKILGEDSLSYAEALDVMVFWSDKIEDHEICCDAFAGIFGESHPLTLAKKLQLADQIYSIGEYLRADKLSKETMRIVLEVVADDISVLEDFLYSEVLESSAGHYLAFGFNKADSILKQFHRHVSPERSAYLPILENRLFLASIYGDKKKENRIYSEMINNAYALELGDHWDLFRARVGFASTLEDVGDRKACVAEVKKTIDLYRRLRLEFDTASPDSLGFLVSGFESNAWQILALANLLGRLDVSDMSDEELLRNFIELRDFSDFRYFGDAYFQLAKLLSVNGRHKESHGIFGLLLEARNASEFSEWWGVVEDEADVHGWMGNFSAAIPLYAECVRDSFTDSVARLPLQSVQEQVQEASNHEILMWKYLGNIAKAGESLASKEINFAYDNFVNWKGMVANRQKLSIQLANRPDLAPLYKQIRYITSRLSLNRDNKSDEIKKLSDRKLEIEREISRLTSIYLEDQNQISAYKIKDVIPEDGVFLDFFEYCHKDNWAYGAFVLRSGKSIAVVGLGDDPSISLAIETNNLSELGKLIWEPLAQYVDDAELVLYSPIAELGSVPFAALPGKEPGSYLIEEKQLVMIPQAKLLPSLLEREQSPKPTVLAIGGVDYESVADNEAEETVQLAASRRAVRWTDEALFTPLPETESELEAVGKLYNQQFDLGKLQTLKGDRATEAAVKRLAPQYSHLHFATHGFFAPPEVKSALDNSDNQFQRQLSFDDQPRVTGFHPGLLSGLALAGANDPPEEGEDGIWTAEEVATMNLSNVDLAVLSACETGLGKVAGGEGLLGLQRAFQVSGAGTTVASLWQVDDAATRALMDEFYRNLWERKLPKIEALRQAQLKMLREYDPQKGTLRGVGGVRQLDGDAKPERLPPFYWAAWVLSGDWR